MWTSGFDRRRVVLAFAVASGLSCGNGQTPPVPASPSVKTVQLAMPWCQVPFPPVRDPDGTAAESIPRYFRGQDLCDMASALRN
jgi:hypothetical protein